MASCWCLYSNFDSAIRDSIRSRRSEQYEQCVRKTEVSPRVADWASCVVLGFSCRRLVAGIFVRTISCSLLRSCKLTLLSLVFTVAVCGSGATVKICFTGDVFIGGDLAGVLKNDVVTCKSYQDADCRVVNVEQAISDQKDVIQKCTLFTGSSSVQQLNEMRVNAANLANNHIQDKGHDGIEETRQHLESAGIRCFGAGRNTEHAKQPHWLNDDTVVLGYCEFGKPYLNQIVVSGENSPGVNPLRHQEIKADLDALPSGVGAVLYLHWGREHVWLPPTADIELARKFLEDDRVKLIVGMHAHRVQGYIEHNGKRAYMCVGNFLFPNFYIEPPTQIAYPDSVPERPWVTRQYHAVQKLTYKKWRWVNRVSMLVSFDTKTEQVSHSFACQNDVDPKVDDLSGIRRVFMSAFVIFLCGVYRFPVPVYSIIEHVHATISKFLWRLQIRSFSIRQMGLRTFVLKLRKKLSAK